MDRRAGFDARDGEHFNSHFNVCSESRVQQKAGKILARTRVLSSAAQLFLGYGIAGVSVEAIAKGAATAKRTLYGHFVSKD
jgi:AcrR family transcriptional regulator